MHGHISYDTGHTYSSFSTSDVFGSVIHFAVVQIYTHINCRQWEELRVLFLHLSVIILYFSLENSESKMISLSSLLFFIFSQVSTLLSHSAFSFLKETVISPAEYISRSLDLNRK